MNPEKKTIDRESDRWNIDTCEATVRLTVILGENIDAI
jgi:hypothetical protein